MSNLLQRILLFFLGVPAVIAVIGFLPQLNHGAAVLIIVVFTGGCALELANLFRSRGIGSSSILFVVLGAGIPASAYLGGLLGGASVLPGAFLGIAIFMSAALLAYFAQFAFIGENAIPEALPKASAIAFAAVYPSLFGAVIVLIASEPPHATESLLTFCVLAFSGDSVAWLVGMTIGKHRGIVAVSPNKSLEGFIGGMLAPIGMAFACAAVFPSSFPAQWWELLILGLLVGAAVIIGDLFESSLKRSARIKDSGSAVPGRGGFLDSLDSLLLAAPVFYGLSLLMGLFR
jgi:phosphatidate cytidylyltransferase